jgi:prenyltransferase beta subunit
LEVSARGLENHQVRQAIVTILKAHHWIMADIMHSYLGLAALATIGEEELPAFDPMFCISWKARQNMRRVP